MHMTRSVMSHGRLLNSERLVDGITLFEQRNSESPPFSAGMAASTRRTGASDDAQPSAVTGAIVIQVPRLPTL